MKLKTKNILSLLVKGGVGVGLILLLIISPLIFAFGKTGRQTQVLNKDYSLLTKSQIISRLNQDFPLPSTLVLKHDSRDFTLNLASISAQVDTDKVASDLLFRRLNKGIRNYFLAFFSPKNFNLEIKYDSIALDKYLIDLSSQIDKPFVPSELVVDPKTGRIDTKLGELGQKTNTDELKNQVIDALKYHIVSDPISIFTSTVGQLPTSDQITATIATATQISSKSLDLVAPDQIINLDDKTLISWLDFSSSCRSDRIQEYVNGLKTSLKKDPVDAVFKFENNQVLDFRSAQNGYTLNDTNLSTDICNSLVKLTTSADKKNSLTLTTNTFIPKVNNADVNDLGIKDLLATGKSTFRHSAAIRNYNVEKGASIVNRVLVAPGETFSFIKALGDVSIENGYKQAYVIKKGQTVLDVGGGICQVSTTLFRAMLNAGLNIIDRKNHAYRVQYYEEDMPPGYDATVFIPNPDLKFVNDTGHYLLIQSAYDGKNKSLVYEIYGTSDGRQVEISNYRQWDATPAPPDVYIDDPTLPVGKVVQDEHRIPGLKTAFDWKVTRNGEVIRQKTFQSVYAAWAAVYRRGVSN